MFVSKFIDKLQKPKIIQNIEPFGEFRYFENDENWICFSKNLLPNSTLEITFEVESDEQDLSQKITLTKKFLQSLESLQNKIYENITVSFENKNIEDVKKMWFLSSISLENDNETWKVVFEPNFDVETIYNYFLRFTVANDEIIWSNLKNEKNYERNTTDQNRNGRRSGI